MLSVSYPLFRDVNQNETATAQYNNPPMKVLRYIFRDQVDAI